MAQVYGGAYLTISALMGASPDVGLFSTAGNECNPRQLIFIDKSGTAQPVIIRRKIPHLDPEQGSHLLSRAWAFQERLLSHRVLYFGAQELMWECLKDRHCECGRLQSPGMSDHQAVDKRRFGCLFEGCAEKHGVDLWRSIVEEYTRLQLTYPEDIFAALGGLAQQAVSSHMHGSYITGLWMNKSLPGQLLWSVIRNPPIRYMNSYKPLPCKLNPERAPSWSWGSVSSAVTFPDYYLFWSPWENVGLNSDGVNDFVGLPNAMLFVESQLIDMTIKLADEESTLRPGHTEIRFDTQTVDGLTCNLDYDIWNEDAYRALDDMRVYCAITGFSWDEDEMPETRSYRDYQSTEPFAAAKVYFMIFMVKGVLKHDDREDNDSIPAPLRGDTSNSVPASNGVEDTKQTGSTSAERTALTEEEQNIQRGSRPIADSDDTTSAASTGERQLIIPSVIEQPILASYPPETNPIFIVERIGIAELAPYKNGSPSSLLEACLRAPWWNIRII